MLALGTHAHAATLSLQDRLACDASIQQVYWQHRTWPEGNGPRPAFAYDTAAGQQRIEDMLRESAALATVWNRPLTPAAIRGELARIQRDTHDPARLKELFSALHDDPVLIGECLVRPELTERLIHSWYANDRAIHQSTRAEAENTRAMLEAGVSVWLAPDASQTQLPSADLSAAEITAHFPHAQAFDGEKAASMLARLRGEVSTISESRTGYDLWHVTNAGAVEALHWDKLPFRTWWQDVGPRQPVTFDVVAPKLALSAETLANSCEIGSWKPMSYSDDFAPKDANNAFAVWDGSEMLIYGPPISLFNTNTTGGAIYDPALDNWLPMSKTRLLDMPPTDNGNYSLGSNNFEGVWTGTELIVWGPCQLFVDAYSNTYTTCYKLGARYNPVSNTWRSMSESGAPEPGQFKGLTWTGSKMFAWGGNDAALYDPGTDSWVAVASPPVHPTEYRAVWSGHEVLLFGYPDGNAAYNPSTNTWRELSSTGAPPTASIAAFDKIVVWSGTEALVITDYSPPPYTTVDYILYRYNPTTDKWTQASTSGMPSYRDGALFVWAGDRAVLWGGYYNGTFTNNGAMYYPEQDVWVPVRAQGAPDTTYQAPLGVWTGQDVLVWGGQRGTLDSSCQGAACWVGGRLNVASNSWTRMSVPVDNGSPSSRVEMGAASDGTQGYLWGGSDQNGFLNDGSIYDPTLDTWTAIDSQDAPASRRKPSATAVVNNQLVVFGGEANGGSVHDGGIYDPSLHEWSGIPSPPWGAARSDYAAGIIGTRVMVWGGYDSGYTNTGFVYDLSSHQWSAMASTGAPAPRMQALSVVHDGKWYVFGGVGDQQYADGGIYDPVAGTWASFPESGDIPNDVRSTSHVLTDAGAYLLLWEASTQQAWTYSVDAGIWHVSSMTGFTPDSSPGGYPSIAWSGKEALFFGGSNATASDGLWVPNGWGYNPVADQWRALETTNSLDGRIDNAGFMTGQYMMVWGGYQGGYAGNSPAYTGALYCPDTRTGTLSSDLSLTAAFTNPVASLGNPATLRASTHNAGPDTATGVEVSIATGDDFAFAALGSLPDNTTCTTPAVGNSGTIDCTISSIDSGATKDITVQLSTFSTGTFQATATATANEPDPDTGNNTATANLTVTTPNDEIFSSGFE
jgi:N-acetylneuraminic acid mutarotase